VNHLSRLLLLIGLAACAGGTKAPVGPDPAEAQDAEPPKSVTQVKMPPAAPMNTLGIAGQVVGVLPSTLVVARDSIAGRAPFTDRASSTQWVDSLLGEGMMMRAPEVNWKLPAQMRSIARRAPGMAADPDYLGQAALRDPQIVKVPDPMISNLRTLMAIAGGRFVFVPAAFSFQHDSTGAVEARANFVGIDTRAGDVIFRSYIIATGATPTEAVESVLAILFPSITVEP
jgi:hypothetical protein